MAYPPASREDHDEFCTREGWELVRGASGRPVRHHRTYKLVLWDHRVLRTRISQPVDRSQYPPSMWSHILRNQLLVTEDEFWDCVHDKVLPDRGAPPEQQPGLPYSLLRQLTDTVGLSAEDAARLTPAEATARIADYWRDLAENQ